VRLGVGVAQLALVLLLATGRLHRGRHPLVRLVKARCCRVDLANKFFRFVLTITQCRCDASRITSGSTDGGDAWGITTDIELT